MKVKDSQNKLPETMSAVQGQLITWDPETEKNNFNL